MNRAVTFAPLAEVRFGRGPDVVDWRVGTELEYDVGDHVTFAPGYLYIETPPDRGREHRAQATLTLTAPRLGRYTLATEQLVERRFERDATSTRYRPLLEAARDMGGGTELFAYNEWFYDWSERAWVRTRLAAGGRHDLGRTLTGSLWYFWQRDTASLPRNLHVIGVSLDFAPLADR